MKFYVFFGLPGAGKTFSANIAGKYFGYHLYDGDKDLTSEMQTAIEKQATITDDMRDIFFNNIIQSAKNLQRKYEKVIIHQTFIKEKYRHKFFEALPETKFVLVTADREIREKRLKERKTYPLEENYARKISLLFDEPNIPYTILYNNTDGEEFLKEQMQEIL